MQPAIFLHPALQASNAVAGFLCASGLTVADLLPFSPLVVYLLLCLSAVFVFRFKRRVAVARELYRQIWQATADYIFDPTVLGRWGDWSRKYDSLIKSDAEAIACAREMLASLGDPYTVVLSGKELALRQQRRKQNGPPVSAELLSNGVGYLRIESFSGGQMAQMAQSELKRLDEATALVVDIRGNPGGTVMNALKVAALFVGEGTLACLKSRRPGGSLDRPVYRTIKFKLDGSNLIHETVRSSAGERTQYLREPRLPSLKKGRPLAILIDRNTASAAELFAGALADNLVATTVGERTFGKGVGQSPLDLPGGAELSVTSFAYFTPAGTWPGDGSESAPGLAPDVVVVARQNIDFGAANDNQLAAAADLLKAKSGGSRLNAAGWPAL